MLPLTRPVAGSTRQSRLAVPSSVLALVTQTAPPPATTW